MSDSIISDALRIRKLIREAEALSDESIVAFSQLKQAIVRARQNPEIPVAAGQQAIMRLTQAERQAVSVSTNLLQVHDELSKLAREHAGGEDDIPTDIPAAAIAAPAESDEPIAA